MSVEGRGGSDALDILEALNLRESCFVGSELAPSERQVWIDRPVTVTASSRARAC